MCGCGLNYWFCVVLLSCTILYLHVILRVRVWLAALPSDQFPRNCAQCPATFFIGLFQDTRHIAILENALPWPALLPPTISHLHLHLHFHVHFLFQSLLSFSWLPEESLAAQRTLSLCLALCHSCVDRRSDYSLRSLIVPPFALFFHFHHYPL